MSRIEPFSFFNKHRSQFHFVRLAIMFAAFCLAGLLGAMSAQAQTILSVGAGAFSPWDGDAGSEFKVSLSRRVGETKKVRIGGELAYRNFDSDVLFNVSGVEIHSVRIGFEAHYFPFPRWYVEPYLGGKINLAVNIFDSDKVEKVLQARNPFSSVSVSEAGGGIGINAIIGADVPIGEHFALFGEVTLGYDMQLTSLNNEVEIENIGGVSGMGGVRFVF